jgi:hypothetical protein
MTEEEHMASVREFLKYAPPAAGFEQHRAESQKVDRSLAVMLAIMGACGVVWQILSSLGVW